MFLPLGNIDQAQYCDRIKGIIELLGSKLSLDELTKIWKIQVSWSELFLPFSDISVRRRGKESGEQAGKWILYPALVKAELLQSVLQFRASAKIVYVKKGLHYPEDVKLPS